MQESIPPSARRSCMRFGHTWQVHCFYYCRCMLQANESTTNVLLTIAPCLIGMKAEPAGFAQRRVRWEMNERGTGQKRSFKGRAQSSIERGAPGGKQGMRWLSSRAHKSSHPGVRLLRLCTATSEGGCRRSESTSCSALRCWPC